eukprot:GHVQ01008093.1.p2 GENE.GHVQ01008093.1~~GHVQ01008093.1.p2  ORF type:complete len:198 (-),score=27.02 GHVQ01008093.1:3-596(-)
MSLFNPVRNRGIVSSANFVRASFFLASSLSFNDGVILLIKSSTEKTYSMTFILPSGVSGIKPALSPAYCSMAIDWEMYSPLSNMTGTCSNGKSFFIFANSSQEIRLSSNGMPPTWKAKRMDSARPVKSKYMRVGLSEVIVRKGRCECEMCVCVCVCVCLFVCVCVCVCVSVCALSNICLSNRRLFVCNDYKTYYINT